MRFNPTEPHLSEIKITVTDLSRRIASSAASFWTLFIFPSTVVKTDQRAVRGSQDEDGQRTNLIPDFLMNGSSRSNIDVNYNATQPLISIHDRGRVKERT